MDEPLRPLLFQRAGVERQDARPEVSEVVSIVMRTRDRPILLHRAFASVLSQRLTDWHLYLVSDGGDRSRFEHVLAEYAAPFARRITVIHNPQRLGMAASANAALQIARGDYYAIHDDDDSWHPDFLDRTVRFLAEPRHAPYVSVVTNCHMVKEKIVGDKITEVESEPWRFFEPSISFDNILTANGFPPIAQLTRRAVLSRVGMYNTALPVLGDWDFNIRALVVGDFGVINEPLAYHHRRLENEEGAYSNESLVGSERNVRYDIQLRNGAVRLALQENPSLIGVLQPILHAVREQRTALQARFDTGVGRLDAGVGRLDAGLGRLDAGIGRLEATLGPGMGRLDAGLDRLHTDLARLEAALHRIEDIMLQVDKLLRPFRAGWRRLKPARQLVARLRGRTTLP